MRKNEQETLVDALAYCSLRDLPDADNGRGYWLEALAKVIKHDGRQSYAYVKRDDISLEPIIKKDFGAFGGIAIVKEYYPFEYLREEFIPKLSNKEAKVEYLSNIDKNNAKVFAKLSVKALDQEIIRIGIRAQREFDNKNIYHE